MTSTNAKQSRGVPYVDFRHSRLYFGVRFWIAVALVVLSLIAYTNADSATGEGRFLLGCVGLAGVAVGLLLQPSPKPEDHQSRARQSLQNVSTGIELVGDVQTIAGQLSTSAEHDIRLNVGLANMTTDLERAKRHFMSTMADWDEVAPGAVEAFKKSKVRGSEILAELAAQEENHE
ncbi:hypothetical protein HCX50_17200 [Microbacterium oxydans]|uniref:hypothetical protein n=1 Tax=Microbacterium sp. B19(2022) TaxID=2914045 RepID=UPI00142FFBC9|nr:hypothetical protein [Microbacterium sp. B19(2022)]NJI61166.1 hypothetical protein [Microbacterium sp. B19(2022)]